jgi:hypothetical protein
LIGDKYEQQRKIRRQKIWKEICANKFKIEHFQRAPDQFNRIFDLIIRYYARVRDSVLNLEEAWAFLMEMIYSSEMKGQLLFEQFHKQLFEREVMKH